MDLAEGCIRPRDESLNVPISFTLFEHLNKVSKVKMKYYVQDDQNHMAHI